MNHEHIWERSVAHPDRRVCACSAFKWVVLPTTHSSTMQRLHPHPASDMPRLLDNVTTAVRPWGDPPVAQFRVWCYSPLIAAATGHKLPVWSPADFPTVGEANEVATQLARSEWAPGIRCKVYIEVLTEADTSKLDSGRLDQTSRSRRYAPSAPQPRRPR